MRTNDNKKIDYNHDINNTLKKIITLIIIQPIIAIKNTFYSKINSSKSVNRSGR